MRPRFACNGPPLECPDSANRRLNFFSCEEKWFDGLWIIIVFDSKI